MCFSVNCSFTWWKIENSSKVSPPTQSNLDVSAHSQMAYHSRTRITECCYHHFKKFPSAAAVKINQTQKSSNMSLGHFGYFVFDFSDVVRKSEKHLTQAFPLLWLIYVHRQPIKALKYRIRFKPIKFTFWFHFCTFNLLILWSKIYPTMFLRVYF